MGKTKSGMSFRAWCGEMWFRHCDEVTSWTGSNPKYLSAEYFGRYKYWLKREYKQQVGNQNV